MKISLLICSMFILGLWAALPAAADDSESSTAPCWQQGQLYEIGDLVNYDGAVFKALAGNNHRHPEAGSEQGWRKLNDCDDKSKLAVKCDMSLKGKTISTKTRTKENLDAVMSNMRGGGP